MSTRKALPAVNGTQSGQSLYACPCMPAWFEVWPCHHHDSDRPSGGGLVVDLLDAGMALCRQWQTARIFEAATASRGASHHDSLASTSPSYSLKVSLNPLLSRPSGNIWCACFTLLASQPFPIWVARRPAHSVCTARLSRETSPELPLTLECLDMAGSRRVTFARLSGSARDEEKSCHA